MPFTDFTNPNKPEFSGRKLGIVIGAIVFVSWYITFYFMGWEYPEKDLQFILAVIGIAWGVNAVQRSVFHYAHRGVEAVVKRGKKDDGPEPPEELNSRVPTMKNPPPPPVKRASPSFIKPAAGNVSSPFRPPHRPAHHGIDIARVGNVPIVAAADGVVVRSYSSKTYGETVILEHDFGGDKWQTLYAHLRSGTRAATGAIVNKGEQIGMMGNTGRSTAQHLHFEIHRGPWNSAKSNAVDPLQFIKV